MKAQEFEDILRLYLIDKNLGVPDIEYRCGGYYQIEIRYSELIRDGKTVYKVEQVDTYECNTDAIRINNIGLTEILLFIATY